MVSININVSVPKKLFLDADFVNEITEIMKNEVAPDLKHLFRGTTNGWSEKPSWRQKLTKRSSEISMEVWTEDKIYGLVNAGSPPHTITPRNGGFLRFRPGYRSATTAGSIISRRVYRSGNPVTASSVKHPGFVPRRFDELISREYDPKFRESVQKAVENAAKRVT